VAASAWSEDDFDEPLLKATQDYHRPPATSREELWRRIEASRRSWGLGMLRRLLRAMVGASVVSVLLATAISGQQVEAKPDRQQSPLERRVTMTFSNARLDRALDAIAAYASVTIMYSDRIVPVERTISLRLDGVPLREAVRRVLAGTGVDVRDGEGAQLILVKPDRSQGSSGHIVGLVIDGGSGRRLPRSVVRVEGTEIRAVTDDSGSYRIVGVPSGTQTLIARQLGYRSLERTVVVPDSGSIGVSFALEGTPLGLEAVVITAAGPQRRLELPNSITVLSADSIVRAEPVKTMTDLLETRVPGLVVYHTTGAPGDPARLRLRGSRSITLSNDPIIIVDGARIESRQTDDRSGSLVYGDPRTSPNGEGRVPAQSVLDRLDPNSVESVDVIPGPSAAAMYGADAANGVIVITTKRGRPGPARWDISVTHGRTDMPGRFPDSYFTFAHALNADVADCALTNNNRPPTCTVDSVVAFQVLNDPELTVLGQGHSTLTSATVSGGRSDITYSITGSYSDELGLLKLPQYEAARYRAAFGRDPEDWMERPHRLTNWSVASQFNFNLARSAALGLTMSLAGGEQGRSDLESDLSVLRGTYVNKATGLIYPGNSNGSANPTGTPSAVLVPKYYVRTMNRAFDVRTSANLSWQPLKRLSVTGTAGLTANVRRDNQLLPARLRLTAADSLGALTSANGLVTIGTFDFRASYAATGPLGLRFTVASGFNFTSRSVTDVYRHVPDATGATSSIGTSSLRLEDLTSYGWYVAPRFGGERLFFDLGFRLDGGSNYGARASGLKLPKIGFAWAISDEPFFPLKNSHVFNTLRVRASYGQSGVQPGAADRLRLYSNETHQLDGQNLTIAQLTRLGNTQVRPERSTEFDWGLDADLFDYQYSAMLSVYRTTTHDALLTVILPPSVGGSNRGVPINIGVTRNTGFDLTLGTQLVATKLVAWNAQIQVSHKRNVVVSVPKGLLTDGQHQLFGVVPGYPLGGYWERPILGYADANGDGILQQSEVVVGNSPVFLGAPEPVNTAGLHSTLALLDGALAVTVGFDYRDDFAQQNYTPGGPLGRALAGDPSAPLADQALAIATSCPFFTCVQSAYGRIERLSSLRFNSLAVNWLLPTVVARFLGAQRGTVAVTGKNLALVTNYRGKDPLVNGNPTGDEVTDGGALPTPREWSIRVGFTY
jgi:TonB-dependent SusC/RagA subfamily outer membrane receptor